MNMRKVVGRASRTVTTVMKESVKEYRYRTSRRQDVQVDTYVGYRLECGHVAAGSRAHGKGTIHCVHCELGWPSSFSDEEGWIDLPEEASDGAPTAT